MVAVVIVTYNSAAVLQDCLLSLAEGCRAVHLAQVLVADNASADGSVAIALGVPGLPVQVVQLGRNAGYAAGINAAVRVLDTSAIDAVLVLNPDTRLAPGAVAALANALQGPRRGVVVPRLINPDGSLQPSLRRTPTVCRALAEALVGGSRAGRLGELITDPDHYRRPGSVAWATGAAMLISVTTIREVGPWDESFLLYSEEVEFTLRAGDRGWQTWYEPAAVVTHLGGESRTNPMLAALLVVNRVRLFRARRGPLAGAAYFAVVTLGELVRAAAGRRTARAAVIALFCPTRRLIALPSTPGQTNNVT